MDWSSDTMVFSCVFHAYINYTYAVFKGTDIYIRKKPFALISLFPNEVPFITVICLC